MNKWLTTCRYLDPNIGSWPRFLFFNKSNSYCRMKLKLIDWTKKNQSSKANQLTLGLKSQLIPLDYYIIDIHWTHLHCISIQSNSLVYKSPSKNAALMCHWVEIEKNCQILKQWNNIMADNQHDWLQPNLTYYLCEDEIYWKKIPK